MKIRLGNDGGLLARLRSRLGQNESSYYEQISREANLQKRMPRPVAYRGFDATTGRARVQPLGGDTVTAAAQTNGLMQPGQSLLGRGSGQTLRVDAMPRVQPVQVAIAQPARTVPWVGIFQVHRVRDVEGQESNNFQYWAAMAGYPVFRIWETTPAFSGAGAIDSNDPVSAYHFFSVLDAESCLFQLVTRDANPNNWALTTLLLKQGRVAASLSVSVAPGAAVSYADSPFAIWSDWLVAIAPNPPPDLGDFVDHIPAYSVAASSGSNPHFLNVDKQRRLIETKLPGAGAIAPSPVGDGGFGPQEWIYTPGRFFFNTRSQVLSVRNADLGFADDLVVELLTDSQVFPATTVADVKTGEFHNVRLIINPINDLGTFVEQDTVTWLGLKGAL